MYKKIVIPTEYMFFHPAGKKGDAYRFSSDLEKIGVEWDRSIQNGTYVEVISDPVEITTRPYGIITVVKIKADVATDYHTIIQELYVPVGCIIKAEDYAIKNPELAN
jgi:hypothetical protein